MSVDQPDDEEEEKRERYRELLEELRTILPGVQVLFAFLLTAPFSARFPELDKVGRDGYFLALGSAALATVLFLSPTSYHRIAPRQARATRLRVAVRLTVCGMATLVVAIASALFVVTRFIFGTSEALAVLVAACSAIGVFWYVLPLITRLRRADG